MNDIYSLEDLCCTPFIEPIDTKERKIKELQRRIYELGRKKEVELPDRYIINSGATILFWKDGSKTIIKRASDDEFNPRLAFLTAFFQHYCGMSKNKANKYLANLKIEDNKKQIKNVKELKVGDKVVIRKDLKDFNIYGDESFIEKEMGHLKGKKVTISKVYGNGEYQIEEDTGIWCWTDEMFENKQPKHLKEEK